MAACEVDAGCIAWPRPDVALCDPCIDLTNPEHRVWFDHAWKITTSFLYDELRAIGLTYPGTCFEETLTPCRETPRCPQYCTCSTCGIYNWLPLEGTCLPIIDVCQVWVGPNPCSDVPVVWRNGEGVRMERFYGQPRLVVESGSGCCGSWPAQDLCRPLYADCTWNVTVRTGAAPPPYVLAAATEITSELVKECVTRGCKMPGNLTSQSFDGSTFQMDPELPASLPRRMLEQALKRKEVLRYGGSGPSPWRMHNRTGPVRVDSCCGGCGAVCAESDSSAGCGCESCPELV